MEWLDKLMTVCIFFMTGLSIFMLRYIKQINEKTLQSESRIRSLSDDVRHVAMVVERSSAAIASLNVHKNNLMDIEKDIAKLQIEVKTLQVPAPVSSPLPPLKKKEEKGYVKVKY